MLTARSLTLVIVVAQVCIRQKDTDDAVACRASLRGIFDDDRLHPMDVREHPRCVEFFNQALSDLNVPRPRNTQLSMFYYGIGALFYVGTGPDHISHRNAAHFFRSLVRRLGMTSIVKVRKARPGHEQQPHITLTNQVFPTH